MSSAILTSSGTAPFYIREANTVRQIQQTQSYGDQSERI